MLTILFVVLAIIYVIIGMTIGALIEVMCLSTDAHGLLVVARSALEGEEIEPEQAGELIGIGLGVALIALVWPVFVAWLHMTMKEDET